MTVATTRDEVLTILLTKPTQPVAGSLFAQRLGVSRESIWKAVQALRKAGHPIVGGPRGYCYQGAPRLAAPVISRVCQTFAGQVTVLATTPSTQDLARAALNRLPLTPQAWLAEEQTAAYGRRGRAFYSPQQTGLYFSLVLPLAAPLRHPGLLTTGVAAAVSQVLGRFYPTANFQLKWVNDVYCRGKKVAGILTEAAIDLETQAPQAVAIGCGINLTTADFPGALATKAGGLGRAVDRNRLAAALLDAITARAADYQTGAFLPAYRARSLVLGRPVILRTAHGEVCGQAVAIDDQGGLVVRTAAGGERTFVSGEVVKVNLADQN